MVAIIRTTAMVLVGGLFLAAHAPAARAEDGKRPVIVHIDLYMEDDWLGCFRSGLSELCRAVCRQL